jgi:hypothetical protein
VSSSDESDREADEYELRFHQERAKQDLRLGGVLMGIASVAWLLSGVVFVGALLLPAMFFLGRASIHGGKANRLAVHLQDRPAPLLGAPERPQFGRRSRVVIAWTNGERYPAFVLQRRGAHYFVEFEGGRQEWVPEDNVSAA